MAAVVAVKFGDSGYGEGMRRTILLSPLQKFRVRWVGRFSGFWAVVDGS